MPPNSSCCTYPHGEGLILPQAFMIGAIFCNLWMFSMFSGTPYDFLCIIIEYGTDDGDNTSNEYYDSSYGSGSGSSRRALKSEINQCEPLKMFRTDYWDINGEIEDEKQGYAGAAQAGAFFGAAATAIGVLTLVVLLKTVCFRTSKCAIGTVIAMQSTAALFSLLTLVAGATDVCKAWGLDEMGCKTKRIRIEPGAGFAISAAVFYICAVVSTTVFLLTRSGWETISNNRRVADGEASHLSVFPPHLPPGMPPTHDNVEMAVPQGHKNAPSSYTDQSQVAANVY